MLLTGQRSTQISSTPVALTVKGFVLLLVIGALQGDISQVDTASGQMTVLRGQVLYNTGQTVFACRSVASVQTLVSVTVSVSVKCQMMADGRVGSDTLFWIKTDMCI